MAGETTTNGAAVNANGAGGDPWGGLSVENRGWVTAKGFKGLDPLVQSHRELEGFRGVPADRLLKLPATEDAPEWGEVYGRLGRPAKAEEYDLPAFQVAEGQLDLQQDFRAWAHELGLNKRQAKALAEKFGGKLAEFETGRGEARSAQQQLEEQELKREWGQEYDANIRHAREVYARVAKAAGWESPEAMQADFSKIEAQIGTKRMLKMMAFLGRGTGEARFVESQTNGAATAQAFGDSTPAAAMAKFRALQNDTGFMKRIAAGDSSAQAEWDRWAKLAAPAFQAGGPQR